MLIPMFLSVLFCSGWIVPKNYEAVEPETVSYQTKEGDFVLILVESDDLSSSEIRHLVHRRAAQIAFDHGYRFIVIEEEGPTEMIASKKPWPSNQGFHQNMYQELIIEHDDGRESLQRRQDYGVEKKEGYRIVFKAYETSPGWKAINVCTLIPCY